MASLTEMRMFVALIEAGSFAAAATDLGLSPSVISKRIVALERNLGARLVNRTTRKMSVTDIGENYFDRCRKILDSIDEAEEEVASLQGTARGPLTVRVPHSIGILHLAPLILDFCGQYPQISLRISTDDFPLRAFEMEHRSDVALHLGPVTSPGLATRELTRIVWNIYASPNYLKRYGTPETPADLSHHNCLIHQTVFSDNRWHLHSKNGTTVVLVPGTFAANSVIILAEAVESGLGIALLPSFVAYPGVRNGSIIRILSDYEGPHRHLYLAYQANRLVPHRIRLFIDHMVSRSRNPPWMDEGI